MKNILRFAWIFALSFMPFIMGATDLTGGGCGTKTVDSNSPTLTSIAITPTSAELEIEATQQFTAIGTYSDGSTANITTTVTWTSSKPAALSISTGGLATGLSTGTSSVTATLNSVTSNSAAVAVGASLLSIAITPPSPVIGLSGIQQFTAIGTYSDSSTLDITSSVNWNSSSTPTATIAATGIATSLALGSTTVTATLNSITSNEADLEVKQAYAYVTNSGNSTVSICPVNADGTLDVCTTSTGSSTFNDPKGTAISADGTIAYIGNRGNSTVSICPVNADGSFGVCTATNEGGAFAAGIWGINLNPAGTRLYVPMGTSSFAICNVAIDGSLSACVTDGDAINFSNPKEVQFSSDGNFAFIANIDPLLTTCAVEADGSFSDCSQVVQGWSTPFGGGTLNADRTFFYAANYSNPPGTPAFVSICPVNEDGSLGTCDSNLGNDTYDFTAFSGIILTAAFANNYIYIPNCGGNNISVCPLNSNGSIGTCVLSSSNGTFNTPTSIAIGFIP